MTGVCQSTQAATDTAERDAPLVSVLPDGHASRPEAPSSLPDVDDLPAPDLVWGPHDGVDAPAADVELAADLAADFRDSPVPDVRDASIADVEPPDSSMLALDADGAHATNDAGLDTAEVGNRLGLIGFVRSTTGTALAVRPQGSHVYLGDWGLAASGVAARGCLQDYDVVEPSRPLLHDSLYLCANDCELGDMAGNGDRLFVASDGLGVFAFNLLGPAKASLSDRWLNPSGDSGDVAVVSLANVAASTFLLVGAHRNPDLRIYNVTASSVLGSPVSYPELGGKADSLFAMDVAGSTAYLFADTSAAELRLELVDLSPMPGGLPIHVSEVSWDTPTLGGSGRMKAQGDFVFVAASTMKAAEGPGLVVGGLRVVDASNPKHPFVAGHGLDLPDVGSIPWSGAGLDVDGNWAYMVTTKGLFVIDVSIPTVPKTSVFYPFPADFLPCAGGRAVAKGSLVYVAAFCQSDDGSQGRGGLAIYRVR